MASMLGVKLFQFVNVDGTKLEDPREVKYNIVYFFKNVLTSRTMKAEIVLDTSLKAIPRRLTPLNVEDLVKHVSDEEIGDFFYSKGW